MPWERTKHGTSDLRIMPGLVVHLSRVAEVDGEPFHAVIPLIGKMVITVDDWGEAERLAEQKFVETWCECTYAVSNAIAGAAVQIRSSTPVDPRLKPCPKCGAFPQVKQGGGGIWHVQCCACEGYRAIDGDKTRAEEKWDRHTELDL